MNNADFWAYVREIIAGGFTPDGLHKLDTYAEQFISGRLVYQRFSPREQRGCAAGGEANVIASLLAGAEDSADSDATQALSDIERERQRTEQREPSSSLEWPSRDGRRQSQRGAKQEAAIEQWAKAVGCWTERVDDSLQRSFGDEIADYMQRMGFELKNPRNWTYATPDIYLSDMHDENVIRSETGAICVVDCDIRINTPELRQGGTRRISNDVVFIP